MSASVSENYLCLEEAELRVAGEAFRAITSSPDARLHSAGESRLDTLVALFVLKRVKEGESRIDALRSEGLQFIKQPFALYPARRSATVRELMAATNRMRLEFLREILEQSKQQNGRAGEGVEREALEAEIERTVQRLSSLEADGRLPN